MKYTIKRPDGSEFTVYTQEALLQRYNGGEIDGDWLATPSGSSSWTRVADVLGVQQASPPAESVTGDAVASQGLSAGVTAAVKRRYQDAYLVARATTAIGTAVKGVGIGLGVLVALAVILIGSQTGGQQGIIGFFFGGIILGAIVAIPLFVLGVLVSAHGQVLKATLDTAVHGSPFLQQEDMARVMSL